MSLNRRLILSISLLLILLFAASLLVNVWNTRVNLFLQLQTHAQDTATSLGFTISQALQEEDNVRAETMVDVIFDRGYYQSIIYRDLQKQERIRREQPVSVGEVPAWFIEWVKLPPVAGYADIVSGWFQLGSIEVVSHPGLAYENLWRMFCEQLWLFLFMIVLTYGLLGLFLKYLLRPVQQVTHQAEAIAAGDFATKVSRTSVPELRKMIDAMNHMAERVKAAFSQQVAMNDRLHEQMRTDEVTGLSNRMDFDQRLQAWLSSDQVQASAAIVLIQIGDIQTINRIDGREKGDLYLISIASKLQQALKDYPEAICARHRGADFTLFIPGISQEEAKERLQSVFNQLQSMSGDQEALAGVSMAVIFAQTLRDYQATDGRALLSLADSLLSSLQLEENNGFAWQGLPSSLDGVPLTVESWHQWFKKTFNTDNLRFQYQPVWRNLRGERNLLFNEVLTQLTVDDQVWSARSFIPMATRLGKAVEFDGLVIDALLSMDQALPDAICVNLSHLSIEDEVFSQALVKKLESRPLLAKRLTFELPASCLVSAEQEVRDFAHKIHRSGASLSLHHFGRQTTNFACLQTLPLDYLKIDRCFIQQIESDKDAQFFVHSLANIANSCNLVILAEGIESAEQWNKLLELGVHGGQGYWLGRPSEDPVIA